MSRRNEKAAPIEGRPFGSEEANALLGSVFVPEDQDTPLLGVLGNEIEQGDRATNHVGHGTRARPSLDELELGLSPRINVEAQAGPLGFRGEVRRGSG